MIKEFFTTNFWLKLMSLIMAVALWFFVMLSGRSEVTKDIPVKFINISEKLAIMDYPQTISVTIEGQERLLKYLKPNEISAVLDISGAKPGRSFYTVSRDDIKLPKSFLITTINPETISLTLELQLKKSVPVKPDIVGAPAKGFNIVEIKVDPDTVSIEGPKSVISKIGRIKTEPIDISGIKSDLVYKANLNLTDSHVKKNINKVDVTISIENKGKETP